MEITKAALIEMNACLRGLEWFVNQNETDIDRLYQLAIDNLSDSVFSYANWLVSNLLDSDNKIRYAVFAAELVLPMFEKRFKNDKRPRKAIEAAKAVIGVDGGKNQKRTDAYAAGTSAYAAADESLYSAYVWGVNADLEANMLARMVAYTAANTAYAADAAARHAAAAARDAAGAATGAADCVGKKKEVQKKILEYGKSLLAQQQ